jgi:hypothetical protein
LQSVYSEQHTRSIPNLGFLEFLAFGKAIRSERPILLKRPFDQAKKDASERLRRPLSTNAELTENGSPPAEPAEEIFFVQREEDLEPEDLKDEVDGESKN